MTVYELCIQNQEGEPMKIASELGHRRLARAMEELPRVKRLRPEAHVVMVVYMP